MGANGEDAPMTLAQASEYLGGRVSEEAVRRALHDGALRGRNLGGNVGWMTTRAAVLEWITRGNGPGRAEVRTKALGGGEDGKGG
jgi:hypothetical protein